MIALVLSSLLAAGAQDPGPVELPGVTVVGDGYDYLLEVDLVGAAAAADLVVSADPPMYCGGEAFSRTPGPWRQCWLRGRRGSPIVLTAQREGVFGRDWSVAWTGCEPIGDGSRCSAPITGTMRVGATFRAM